MAKLLFTDFLTYRWRYQIGYGLIIVTFISLLVIAGLFVPGGLSDAETRNFVQTSTMDLQNVTTLTIPNVPFYAAQRLSLELFGPSEFAFKLPSLICAFVTGIGAVLLLRRWFRANIAVLATIIMITTGQFLYVAQSGVASITFIMWSIWLLLAATMITTSNQHKRFWKILFFVIVPLSLYTPLSIYLVLAIASAGLLHPHVRYVVRRMPRIHLVYSLASSIIIIAPLTYLVIRDPSLVLTLLGIPSNWPPNIFANGVTLLQQYLNFISPQSGTLILPIFGIGSIALITLGAWQQFKIRYTARSYTLTAWIVLLLPVLLINPGYVTITFVPLLLLLASGLSFLLRYWYRLFPRNPYARFVGVVPLTILVGGLVISGLDRHFEGYRFDPATTSSFSHDLALLNDNVRRDKSAVVVVSGAEKPFYQAVASYKSSLLGKINTISIRTSLPAGGEFAATKSAHDAIAGVPIQKIITTDDSNDSDRFYIYKK